MTHSEQARIRSGRCIFAVFSRAAIPAWVSGDSILPDAEFHRGGDEQTRASSPIDGGCGGNERGEGRGANWLSMNEPKKGRRRCFVELAAPLTLRGESE